MWYIREITKLIMFVLAWGIPILLFKWTDCRDFLWFFVGSFVVTTGVFSHYENIEFNQNKQDDEQDE